jgi:hypothetical protein
MEINHGFQVYQYSIFHYQLKKGGLYETDEKIEFPIFTK